ncbi:coiled-coil domain-containing protein 138-like isoform X1 [Acanthaster planci]|uniref:Coiled-coil domain-containing protein 138-like isoform X1 n=1 Tax=Acanthaster planci TaxID=133434 RepID=A0A8B7ZAU9_ACAPL|nr:coiled-coil domain-containing protein 138-like isoform X1 [Acanthaster planci]
MSTSKSGLGQEYTSPARHSMSPSTLTPMSSETLPSMSGATLTSAERRHYNRALRELCKLLRLDSQRLEDTMHRGIDREGDQSRREMTLAEDVEEDEGSSLRASDEVPSDSPHQLYESEEYFVPRYSHQNAPKMKKTMNRDDPSFYREEPVHKMAAVQDVYEELATINRKLQRESAILHEQELALMERERALVDCEQASLIEQDSTLRNAQKEVERRWAVLKERHQSELSKMTDQLQDKTKETRRLKASFDTLKQANDTLRRQLNEVQEQNKKLESQAVSVQSRLANLQRKQELGERQRALNSVSAKARAESRPVSVSKDTMEAIKTAGVSKLSKTTAIYDVLGFMLAWLSEVHLQNVQTDDIKQPLTLLPASAVTKERCAKILPSLVEVLHSLPAASFKMHLPCLQFIYWSLVHLDQGQVSQPRNPLSSTYRRLGEELYKPTVVRFAGAVDNIKTPEGLHEKPKAAVFFRSPNLHIRMLSCLIILKTLSQVDYLAQVFDVLRMDLKEDSAKELYLRYRATQAVVPYLKTTHKALISSAVDVFLQMSMESALTQEFLESCSTDVWFRACATVLRTPNLDPKLWEKLSIILQKLSKIKTNKRHFEVQGITGIVQDLLRTSGQENTFLMLNLRSILFNFNVAKRSPTS